MTTIRERRRIQELVVATLRPAWVRHLLAWMPLAICVICFVVVVTTIEAKGYRRGYMAGVRDGITLRAAATGGDPA